MPGTPCVLKIGKAPLKISEMGFLLSLALAGSRALAAPEPPAAPDAQSVSAPGDDCAGAAQAGASYCADWGQDFQAKLQGIFDRIIANSGYDSFFARLYRGSTELQYHGDERFVNESPAHAIAPDCGPGHSDHPIIEVGYSVFEIAKTPDEIAFILGHEAGHLIHKDCERKKDFTQELYRKWRKDHPEYDDMYPDVRQDKFRKEMEPRFEAVQRCLEDKADAVGRDILSKAGMNPKGASRAFNDTEDLFKSLGAVLEKDTGHDSLQTRAERADAGVSAGAGDSADTEDCYKTE